MRSPALLFVPVIAVLFAAASLQAGDGPRTVELKDGSTVTAVFSGLDREGNLAIRHEDGIHRLHVDDIAEPLRSELIRDANLEELSSIENIPGASGAA